MKKNKCGMSTLVNHSDLSHKLPDAHISPIFLSAGFRFEDVESGAAAFQGQDQAYIYSRMGNPNFQRVIEKVAALECLDLEQTAQGRLFSSGMAAITAVIASLLKSNETLIAQKNIYGASYSLLNLLQERNQIRVIWIERGDREEWERAFAGNPQAKLAFAETPSNPNLAIVDIQAVAEIAHRHATWLLVDNTFASPYCQRPFNLGADVIVHSTTKYLSGHGVITGGIALSRHADWANQTLYNYFKLYGGAPSPFDAWLTEIGLKTFEIRMQRHCENALKIAQWLEEQPKVAAVFYPGLSSHPQYEIAQKQMLKPGGMLAFELKGGLPVGVQLMDHLKVMSLVPTMGTADTLVQHPASMSHVSVPREERLKVGVTDGLVRVSVGIENVEDLLEDLEQALGTVQ
jgi:methionine-gamma-lyase